jgi:predicted metal-dependent hydrolase
MQNNTHTLWPDAFIEGYTQWTDGHYFEAHETWEALWMQTTDPTLRQFYQGCIQVAVAMHHFANGNMTGACNLLAKASHFFMADWQTAVQAITPHCGLSRPTPVNKQ